MQLLTTRGALVNDDATLMYRASTFDCGACALSRNAVRRRLHEKCHDIYEGARDLAREIAETDAYILSRRERKKIKMLFAHLKRIFNLAATAQNLRKLANCSRPSARYGLKTTAPILPACRFQPSIEFFNNIAGPPVIADQANQR